ncbi:MAG: type II toxin-antitoxin system VapC family toxin [Parvibaculaceae bacterium]
MIVLDTNVLSELMRKAPSARVTAWLDSQPTSTWFTTSITEAELWFGLEALPEGVRRRQIEAEIRAVFTEDFQRRVLPFDGAAAKAYAAIAVARRRQGRPINMSDAMIAGIAAAHGAILATRNVSDFEGCGIELVDPWTA